MKKTLLFQTTEEFLLQKPSLQKPWVALTKDNHIVHYSYVKPPKFLYGSDDPDEEMLFDSLDFYSYDGTYEDDETGKLYYKWKKHTSTVLSFNTWILTETYDLWGVSEDNPYPVDGAISSIDNGYGDDEFKIRGASNTLDTELLDPWTIQLYNATESLIPHHDTSVLDANGVSYVDLGLPSGALWATYNVGAEHNTTPESWYGNYFQWGDIEPANNKTCDWGHYKYCNGTDSTLTKYCPLNKSEFWGGSGDPDNKLVLDESDDMAKILGGDWHMPSIELTAELLANTTSEWVEDYNGIEGLNGRLFTSNINSNTLFIPAAGYRDGGYVGGVGDYVYLWSAALYLDNPNYAYYLDANSGSARLSSHVRCNGSSVRGVLY